MKKALKIVVTVAVFIAGGYYGVTQMNGNQVDEAAKVTAPDTTVVKEANKDGGAKIAPITKTAETKAERHAKIESKKAKIGAVDVKEAGKDGGVKVKPDTATVNEGVVPKGEPTVGIKTVTKTATDYVSVATPKVPTEGIPVVTKSAK